MTQVLSTVQLPAQFKVRLDSYWQSVAVYAITLIVYVVVKAMWDTTLQEGIVNVVVTDPIVVLLVLFVIISFVTLIANMWAKRMILVGEDAIAFVSRFHERTFHLSEIDRISIGRPRRIKIRGVLSIIKVRIKGRRRSIRIRPAVYENEQQLVAALLSLRKHVHVV